MARIITLDQNTINMIAAGEVIERPASVVKELMENSIDSDAETITVSIKDGGRKSIKVTDNGSGMDQNDLSQAFESHSTSKLKSPSDLRNISTLGFRGEALASIAAVAQINAFSRTKGSIEGYSIEIVPGGKIHLRPCSCDYGTTIEVRDIFYKMPARRKFLKTANTEIRHISEHFIRIALANQNLALTLLHNGKEIYKLSAGETARQRIEKLFSSQIAENLILAQKYEKPSTAVLPSVKKNSFAITALLGHPDISRSNSKLQYTFLNGRFIRDKFITHAIKEAYRGCLQPNRFPVVFLFIRLPYDYYDVNVHPTKIEVRFYNSNLVHSQILATLRETLLKTNLDIKAIMPHNQFEQKSTPLMPHTERNYQIKQAIDDFFKKHRPADRQSQLDFHKKNTRQAISQQAHFQIPLEKEFIQIHNSFILAQSEDGFIIVDQHALHERILYEQLKKRINKGKLESQKLLIPESFEVKQTQIHLIEKYAELIEKLGIEVSPFGPKIYAIHAFPTILAKASPAEFFQDLLDLLLDSKGDQPDPQKLLDQVLNLAACKAAIKAGQKLNNTEIKQLLEDKEIVEHSSRCPHGRPSVIKFTIKELEKQFKRTGL